MKDAPVTVRFKGPVPAPSDGPSWIKGFRDNWSRAPFFSGTKEAP